MDKDSTTAESTDGLFAGAAVFLRATGTLDRLPKVTLRGFWCNRMRLGVGAPI